MKIKHLWNHHLVIVFLKKKQVYRGVDYKNIGLANAWEDADENCNHWLGWLG